MRSPHWAGGGWKKRMRLKVEHRWLHLSSRRRIWWLVGTDATLKLGRGRATSTCSNAAICCCVKCLIRTLYLLQFGITREAPTSRQVVPMFVPRLETIFSCSRATSLLAVCPNINTVNVTPSPPPRLYGLHNPLLTRRVHGCRAIAMFYSESLLSKTGPLARVWLSANLERKLSKTHILQSDIKSSVGAIVDQGQAPMALRLSGQLLLGVVRIYKRQAGYLLDDCNDALVKIKMVRLSHLADVQTADPLTRLFE